MWDFHSKRVRSCPSHAPPMRNSLIHFLLRSLGRDRSFLTVHAVALKEITNDVYSIVETATGWFAVLSMVSFLGKNIGELLFWRLEELFLKMERLLNMTSNVPTARAQQEHKDMRLC